MSVIEINADNCMIRESQRFYFGHDILEERREKVINNRLANHSSIERIMFQFHIILIDEKGMVLVAGKDGRVGLVPSHNP